MDLPSILGLLILVLLVALAFWVPAEILRKAGFSRWWAIPMVLSGGIGWIAFALVEWPIRRELAWHRLKAGDDSEETVASAERFAVDMERRGEWKTAADVLEELRRRASKPEAREYYANSLKELHEKIQGAGVG